MEIIKVQIILKKLATYDAAVLIFFILLSLTFSCSAQNTTGQIEKNGMSCLDKVCLGDELDEVPVIFDTIENFGDKNESEKDMRLAELRKAYPAETDDFYKSFLKYWNYGKIDSDFLKLVRGKQQNFCRTVNFSGSYKSKSGYPTEVVFLTDLDGKFRVVMITRTYQASGGAAAETLFNDLRNKYQNVAHISWNDGQIQLNEVHPVFSRFASTDGAWNKGWMGFKGGFVLPDNSIFKSRFAERAGCFQRAPVE